MGPCPRNPHRGAPRTIAAGPGRAKLFECLNGAHVHGPKYSSHAHETSLDKSGPNLGASLLVWLSRARHACMFYTKQAIGREHESADRSRNDKAACTWSRGVSCARSMNSGRSGRLQYFPAVGCRSNPTSGSIGRRTCAHRTRHETLRWRPGHVAHLRNELQFPGGTSAQSSLDLCTCSQWQHQTEDLGAVLLVNAKSERCRMPLDPARTSSPLQLSR